MTDYKLNPNSLDEEGGMWMLSDDTVRLDDIKIDLAGIEFAGDGTGERHPTFVLELSGLLRNQSRAVHHFLLPVSGAEILASGLAELISGMRRDGAIVAIETDNPDPGEWINHASE